MRRHQGGKWQYMHCDMTAHIMCSLIVVSNMASLLNMTFRKLYHSVLLSSCHNRGLLWKQRLVFSFWNKSARLNLAQISVHQFNIQHSITDYKYSVHLPKFLVLNTIYIFCEFSAFKEIYKYSDSSLECNEWISGAR